MLHFFSDLNSSGVGAMIHNEKAEVMAAMLAKGPLVGDSEETEILACRKALELLLMQVFQNWLMKGITPMS